VYFYLNKCANLYLLLILFVMGAAELNSHKIIEENDWSDNVSGEEEAISIGQVKFHDEISSNQLYKS
jgi:hypothetical protein